MVHPLPKDLDTRVRLTSGQALCPGRARANNGGADKKLGIQVIGKDLFSVQGEYTANMLERAIKGTEYTM